jgi:uncharacterized protein (DUF58 family)
MAELTLRDRTQRLTTRVTSHVPAPVRRAGGRVSSVGWSVVVLGVVSWIGGAVSGWRELMIVAGTCLVALLASVAFTFGRARLEVRVEVLPQRVVVGDTATGQLSVQNVRTRRILPLRMELLVGEVASTFELPSLPAGETHDEIFTLPTRRRAVIPVGPASSVRGDPVGLLRRAQTWTTPIPLYVHPRRARLDQLGAGLIRDLEGQTTSDLSNSDLAFHALREYVPGDDRRYVHWRTSARVGTLMVRQFVETRRSHLAVVVSGKRADYSTEDEFELGVSIAASLASRALLDEHEVSMTAAGRLIPCGDGQSMLDALAGIRFGARASELGGQAAMLSRRATDASVVVLVSGSVQPLTDFRAAATRYGPNVRVILARAQIGGVTGFRPVGELTMIHVAALDELGPLMRRVIGG